jgi:tripartite-type tricarboxylate transporter receptor subunit TctC
MYEQFTAVNVLGKSYPFMIFGGPDSSQKKLLEDIKAGNTINIGTLNLPNLFSVWALTIKSNYPIKMNLVPYKGGPDIARDVMGGHVEYGIGTFPTASTEEWINVGRLKPLLHSGDPRFKNIPSMKDLGITVTPLTGYLATFTKKDTSPEAITGMTAVLKRLNAYEARDSIRSTLRYEYLDLDVNGTERFVSSEIRTLEQVLKNVQIQKIIR